MMENGVRSEGRAEAGAAFYKTTPIQVKYQVLSEPNVSLPLWTVFHRKTAGLRFAIQVPQAISKEGHKLYKFKHDKSNQSRPLLCAHHLSLSYFQVCMNCSETIGYLMCNDYEKQVIMGNCYGTKKQSIQCIPTTFHSTVLFWGF